MLQLTFRAQVAAVSFPAEQVEGPDTTNPALHIGRHCASLASLVEQSPRSPFLGAASASHACAIQAAGSSSPSEQNESCLDGLYPSSHSGRHAPPLGSHAVQLPAFANKGGLLASHGRDVGVGVAKGARDSSMYAEVDSVGGCVGNFEGRPVGRKDGGTVGNVGAKVVGEGGLG